MLLVDPNDKQEFDDVKDVKRTFKQRKVIDSEAKNSQSTHRVLGKVNEIVYKFNLMIDLYLEIKFLNLIFIIHCLFEYVCIFVYYCEYFVTFLR